MLIKADFIAKEVTSPPRLWCCSGHIAPKTFKRNGEAAPAEPTKFFHITSKQDPRINGVYCEPCLIVANAMQRGDLRINPNR